MVKWAVSSLENAQNTDDT